MGGKTEEDTVSLKKSYINIVLSLKRSPHSLVHQLLRRSLAVFHLGMKEAHHNEQVLLNPVQIPSTGLEFVWQEEDSVQFLRGEATW